MFNRCLGLVKELCFKGMSKNIRAFVKYKNRTTIRYFFKSRFIEFTEEIGGSLVSFLIKNGLLIIQTVFYYGGFSMNRVFQKEIMLLGCI